MTTITVPSGYVAIVSRHGVVAALLNPGRKRFWGKRTHVLVDLREQQQATAPQEILTADGITVRVTAVITWKVSDARAYTEVAQEPFGRVYLAVQLAMRDGLAQVPAGDLTRIVIPKLALLDAAKAAATGVGIEILDVTVKDVILPFELRSAAMELITTRHAATIQLEKARAEAAALRSLANSAKLLEDHPALAQLRMIQSAPHGTTVKLTVPGQQLP